MEFRQGILATTGLSITVISGLFWWFGGRDKDYLGIENGVWGKWIAPIFFSLATCGLAAVAGRWHWEYLISVPAYLIGPRLVGYGAEDLMEELIRRSLWSLAVSLAALVGFGIWSGEYTIMWYQAVIGLQTSVFWGVKNPKPAPMEECFIRTISVIAVPFMVI